ncbi:GTP-binding protein Era [Sesbania bispinosa]|nr:GTP-binding protein Era [Sesbania bispinosa]
MALGPSCQIFGKNVFQDNVGWKKREMEGRGRGVIVAGMGAMVVNGKEGAPGRGSWGRNFNK